MAQASLLACEGLSGVCLVPTVASKKMMPKQSSKQVENGERGGAADMLGHRKESEKSRSRKEGEATEGSPPKKSLKKAVVIEQNGSFQLRIPKNFICEHCYGAFRSSYHLKRHILIHTGEKPFECDVCDMRFIQKYHLERHKRVHSGEKPYQCERCLQDRPAAETQTNVPGLPKQSIRFTAAALGAWQEVGI
ncbi:zinc finger protein 740 isoform X2 [Tiliqua scincoides]|uniref:zinc finger protein 740 isoform X2 n=1 Tax=Tiliqua scincoides TaxID=71010 RepID=UPI0034634873